MTIAIASDGLDEVVRILLEKRADGDAKDMEGNTPLIYAVKHLNVVKQLVENGAQVNSQNNGIE